VRKRERERERERERRKEEKKLRNSLCTFDLQSNYQLETIFYASHPIISLIQQIASHLLIKNKKERPMRLLVASKIHHNWLFILLRFSHFFSLTYSLDSLVLTCSLAHSLFWLFIIKKKMRKMLSHSFSLLSQSNIDSSSKLH